MFLSETLVPTSNLPRPLDTGLDVTRFPVVLMGAYRAGCAFAWCAGMQRLLARSEPFVLMDAFPRGAGVGETVSDQQARRCWLTANAVMLRQLCRGYIMVEADIAQRGAARATANALLGPPGVRIMVVSNVTVAQQLAVVLLKAATRPSTRFAAVATRRQRLV
jgi:hypothetical protein